MPAKSKIRRFFQVEIRQVKFNPLPFPSRFVENATAHAVETLKAQYRW
jgi:hypothetical protein